MSVYPEYEALRATNPTVYPGFILRHGALIPVRIANRGTLVAADIGYHGGMECFGLAEDRDKWPTIYPTEEAAWAAQKKKVSTCRHSWEQISHEERKCSRCGEIEFIPDVD